MISSELPQYPWHKIGVDLKGLDYLVVVDYFSRYPEVYKLNCTTLLAVVETLKLCFSQFGIPEMACNDNEPQFTSDVLSQFAKIYDFQQVTSSPLYPRSNGLAERTVQTVKALLKDSEDPHMALLTYRSTPFPWCMLSLAKLLMGRQLRTNVPIPSTRLIPDCSYREKLRQLDSAFKRKQKENYDQRYKGRSQPQLSTDSDVWITSGRSRGQLSSLLQHHGRMCLKHHLGTLDEIDVTKKENTVGQVPIPKDNPKPTEESKIPSTDMEREQIMTR